MTSLFRYSALSNLGKKSWTFEPAQRYAGFFIIITHKLATKKRGVGVADYAQLHQLSSVVLYDTSRKKFKKGKFYNVERVIERRKTKHVRYSDDFVFANMELEVHYFTLILTHITKTQINSLGST